MNTQLELWPEMAETWADEAAAAWEAREAAKEEREERRRAENKAQAAARRHERRKAAIVEAFRSGKVHPRHKPPRTAQPKRTVARPIHVRRTNGGMSRIDIDAYWKARGL